MKAFEYGSTTIDLDKVAIALKPVCIGASWTFVFDGGTEWSVDYGQGRIVYDSWLSRQSEKGATLKMGDDSSLFFGNNVHGLKPKARVEEVARGYVVRVGASESYAVQNIDFDVADALYDYMAKERGSPQP